jgi:hypothetical protein
VSVLLGSVAAGTVLVTLLAAGVGHLARPGVLPAALAAHRVLPAPGPVAVVVTAAEVGLGGAGVAGLVLGERGAGPGLLAAGLAGAALLLALVAGYGWYVLAVGAGGPCGCSHAELPMSGWVVARAAVLAGLAGLALARRGSVLPLGWPGSQLGTALLAVAAFSVLLWQLPAAMHDPTTAAVPGVPRR